MTPRVLGIVLLVVGLALLVFGLNSTDTLANDVSEGLTGRFTDKTMWYLIGGGALAVGGAVMALRGGKSV